MKGFVIDASVTLAWCFADESTSKTTAILDKLAEEPGYVPSLWILEIGNILVLAEQHKRITCAKITEFLELIGNLNIQIDNEIAKRGFCEILAIAHSEKITTYDAAYLELAIRLEIPLATKDQQLKTAAKRLGVKVLC